MAEFNWKWGGWTFLIVLIIVGIITGVIFWVLYNQKHLSALAATLWAIGITLFLAIIGCIIAGYWGGQRQRRSVEL